MNSSKHYTSVNEEYLKVETNIRAIILYVV